MRRLIARICVLALLVLLGYNAWQISALRKEVTALKTEVAALKARDNAGSSEPLQSLALVMKARRHGELAKKHFLNGDFNRAKDELEESLRLLERAGRETTAPTASGLQKVQRALQETRGVIEGLWQRLNKETDVPGGS